MKTVFRCHLLCTALFLTGCSAAAMAACDAKRPEALSTFFDSFLHDKDFAVSRTMYPSSRTRYQYEVENGKQEIIETRRVVSKRDDMKYPALGDYIKTTGIESELLQTSATSGMAKLSRPGANSLVTYHFSIKNGCWFLREIQDHAL